MSTSFLEWQFQMYPCGLKQHDRQDALPGQARFQMHPVELKHGRGDDSRRDSRVPDAPLWGGSNGTVVTILDDNGFQMHPCGVEATEHIFSSRVAGGFRCALLGLKLTSPPISLSRHARFQVHPCRVEVTPRTSKARGTHGFIRCTLGGLKRTNRLVGRTRSRVSDASRGVELVDTRRGSRMGQVPCHAYQRRVTRFISTGPTQRGDTNSP